MKFEIGDVVKMKKQHPCGGFDWKVLRAGVDFRIECVKCGHQVMMTRIKFEKGFKKFISQSDQRSDD